MKHNARSYYHSQSVLTMWAQSHPIVRPQKMVIARSTEKSLLFSIPQPVCSWQLFSIDFSPSMSFVAAAAIETSFSTNNGFFIFPNDRQQFSTATCFFFLSPPNLLCIQYYAPISLLSKAILFLFNCFV